MSSILLTYTELVIVPFEISVHLMQQYCVNVQSARFCQHSLLIQLGFFCATLSFLMNFYNLVPLQNGHTPHQHIQAKTERFETPNLEECVQLKQNASTFYFYVFILCD